MSDYFKRLKGTFCNAPECGSKQPIGGNKDHNLFPVVNTVTKTCIYQPKFVTCVAKNNIIGGCLSVYRVENVVTHKLNSSSKKVQ